MRRASKGQIHITEYLLHTFIIFMLVMFVYMWAYPKFLETKGLHEMLGNEKCLSEMEKIIRQVALFGGKIKYRAIFTGNLLVLNKSIVIATSLTPEHEEDIPLNTNNLTLFSDALTTWAVIKRTVFNDKEAFALEYRVMNFSNNYVTIVFKPLNSFTCTDYCVLEFIREGGRYIKIDGKDVYAIEIGVRRVL